MMPRDVGVGVVTGAWRLWLLPNFL